MEADFSHMSTAAHENFVFGSLYLIFAWILAHRNRCPWFICVVLIFVMTVMTELLFLYGFEGKC